MEFGSSGAVSVAGASKVAAIKGEATRWVEEKVFNPYPALFGATNAVEVAAQSAAAMAYLAKIIVTKVKIMPEWPLCY